MELVTTIIMTKNEEQTIQRSLESALTISNRVIIVDSYSDDRTIDIISELAKRHSDKTIDIVQHTFVNHGNQFNWAVNSMDIQTPYILRMDADEYYSDELADEILKECKTHLTDNVNGFVITYRTFFMGRFLKHGGVYPFHSMRVFKKGKGFVDERNMHDHIVLTEGEMLYLKHDADHFAIRDLNSWIYKHIRYSDMEVEAYGLNTRVDGPNMKMDKRAMIRQSMRDYLYYRLPPFFRARIMYLFTYYIRLGFLDGRQGQIYAFFRSYWYRYMIDAKILEKKIRDGSNT